MIYVKYVSLMVPKKKGNKWENPDVIGIFKNDINQEPIFIAVELKISSD